MAVENPNNRNLRVAVSLGTLVAFMVGLSFAAVPLYDLFCRVTGFGGTTQVAEGVSERVLDRTMEIRFNADVNGALPWQFRPDTNAMTVKVGEGAETRFHARNTSDHAVVGTATYNVTPNKAGIYFNKVQCFCFTEQVLKPGESIEMPVFFFVDPAIADDPNMKDVQTITLSYTFFKAPNQQGAQQLAQQADAAALDGGAAKGYQVQAQGPTATPAGAAPAGRTN